MKRLSFNLALCALATFAAHEATAQELQNVQGTVMAGKRTKIFESVFVKPDCTVDAVPEFKTIENAEHGTIEFVREPIFPQLESDSQSYECNKQAADGIAVYYTANPEFSGVDTFMTRASTNVYATVWDTSFSIKVLK